MIKKLSRHGNSMAIVIDRAILELLAIDENTNLKMTTDGINIILTPQANVKTITVNDPKLKAILKEITEEYDEDLKKLSNS